MPNEKGWFNKQEVSETGLPYYIPASEKWTDTPYEFAVLLTKSRCKSLGVPIMRNGEKPVAFRLLSGASGKHRYAPLYDRTDAYEEIKNELYKHELMGEVK